MANLLQSSQTQATQAPSYYTNYLSNLANAGIAAQKNAQYIGAQPLQTQAFANMQASAGASAPAFNQGLNYASQAGCAAKGISSAGQPYICRAVSTNPLCVLNPYNAAAATSSGLSAANPYLQTAALNNPGAMATSYLSPYTRCVANAMTNVAERNIQQNLAPQATAAAVGSGQFGSQRGAQVLGQVEAQAQQCLNNQLATMYNQAYGQSLCAAGRQQALLGQLGSTAGTLQQSQAGLLGQLGSNASAAQQAYNAQNLQAGATSGCLAAKQSAALGAAGQGLGALGTASTNARLACINAQATLGAQQQTIAQNKKLFPLTTLGTLSQLLSGYTVPTSTTTTLCLSPLSGIAALGSIAKGVTCVAGTIQKLQSTPCTPNVSFSASNPAPGLSSCFYTSPAANYTGIGCAGCATAYCGGGCYTGKQGGKVDVSAGRIGCCSTTHRGALPSKRG